MIFILTNFPDMCAAHAGTNTHLRCLRLLTTASLVDILLEQFLIQLVDWPTESERDEGWRLLHYQRRGNGHWPLWIERSRDIPDLCWHRYRLPALICLSRMQQKIKGIMHIIRLLWTHCSMHASQNSRRKNIQESSSIVSHATDMAIAIGWSDAPPLVHAEIDLN